jgi:uncharacterized protein YfaQ (DUF2300 family)
MGPAPAGNPYDATTPKVLRHIEAAVTTALQQKGIANPTVQCTGVNPAEASCNVSNPANGKSIIATVAVDQQTGALNITKVTPA